jgi:hypothetical protein
MRLIPPFRSSETDTHGDDYISKTNFTAPPSEGLGEANYTTWDYLTG